MIEHRIFIATDATKDAAIIEKQIHAEFKDTLTTFSINTDSIAEDFEDFSPDVLILAFKTIALAQNYYLGLYRQSKKVHGITHRTLVLCDPKEARQVYKLCRQHYFDDYIVYWSISHDTMQLPMALHRAFCWLQQQTQLVAKDGALEALKDKLILLEAELSQFDDEKALQLDKTNEAIDKAETEIVSAIDNFAEHLPEHMTEQHLENDASLFETEVEDPFEAIYKVDPSAILKQELEVLKSGCNKQFEAVKEQSKAYKDWEDIFFDTFTAHLSQSSGKTKQLKSKLKVLVVDDDDFQHKMAGKIIKDAYHNAEIDYASSGTQALKVLKNKTPDLILMDIKMPDISGIEVTQRIRSQSKQKIPVIMITGNSQKSTVIKSLKAGASDFVVKPLQPEKLVMKIKRLVHIEPSPKDKK